MRSSLAAVGFIVLCGAAGAVAQTVTLVAPNTMQFTDNQYGVTFRYPAEWSYATTPQFYLGEAILTPGNDQNPIATARAIVVANNKEWPELTKQKGFSGADLVFNVFPGATISDCVKRLPLDDGFKTAGTKTINGLHFFLIEGGSAGLCHDSDESIYVYLANHACYYFDLAIQIGCPDEGSFLSAKALRPVEDRLESVLATVRIHPPQNSR